MPEVLGQLGRFIHSPRGMIHRINPAHCMDSIHSTTKLFLLRFLFLRDGPTLFPMKLIIAIIKPFKLEEVKMPWPKSHRGMTVTEVKGSVVRRASRELSRQRIHRRFSAEDKNRIGGWRRTRGEDGRGDYESPRPENGTEDLHCSLADVIRVRTEERATRRSDASAIDPWNLAFPRSRYRRERLPTRNDIGRSSLSASRAVLCISPSKWRQPFA